jgi:hypothetical protein
VYSIDVLRERWSEFSKLPVPYELPEDVEATVDVELLVTTASDAIESYLTLGTLAPTENGALRACKIELERIRPQLDGDAADYFEQLANIIGQVMARPNLPGFFG